jgi:hypothetical protein
MSSRVFPMFSCSGFKVPDFTLRSLIHFELIFVQGDQLYTLNHSLFFFYFPMVGIQVSKHQDMEEENPF